MEKVKKMGLRSEEGFTMMELIIVIAIMGVLSAILVPSFTQMTRKARFSADLNTIKHVQTQIELYMAEHDGEFPGIAVGTTPTLNMAMEEADGPIAVLVQQEYLKASDVKGTKLDLQSAKESVSLSYFVSEDEKTQNVALKISDNSKVKIIADNVGPKDRKWVGLDAIVETADKQD